MTKHIVRWTKHESKMQTKEYAHVGTNPVGQVTERQARVSLPDDAPGSFVWERWLPPAVSGKCMTMAEAKDRLEQKVKDWFYKLEMKP